MEELKLLCENIGLTSHVKALMKETSTKRKELINTSDSINTVISNFPFLLKADMVKLFIFTLIYSFILFITCINIILYVWIFQILFELSLRVNVKVTDIFEKVDTFIIELGAYLKISNDTSAENRKITILQKIYSIYKLKRMPKNVPPLFTVEEVIFKYFAHIIYFFYTITY